MTMTRVVMRRRESRWLGVVVIASAVLLFSSLIFFQSMMVTKERSLLASGFRLIIDSETAAEETIYQLLEPSSIHNSNSSATYYNTSNAKVGDIFVPGSLSVSRKESYERCYVDPLRYQKHFRPRRTCAISKKYNLTYFMIAKAGSSTCRHVMGNTFEATEKQCGNNDDDIGGTNDDDSMYRFTIFREPSSRFLSSYQEAIQRDYSSNHATVVPPEYQNAFVEPLKHLRLKDLFETEHGRTTLMGALEQFMKVYDGRVPFNGHLRLQVPRLYNPKTRRTIPLDAVFDTTTMQQNFEALAERVHAVRPEKVIRAYDRGDRRINMTSVSLDARREICQLAAIDYCCLNYALPPECQGTVQCQWIHKPEITEDLLIDTISPYPPRAPILRS